MAWNLCLERKSSIWASADIDFLNFVFCSYVSAILHFFTCLIFFWWTLDVLNIYNVQLWKSDCLPSPGFVVAAYCNRGLAKSLNSIQYTFCVTCGPLMKSVNLMVSQQLDRDFCKCLGPEDSLSLCQRAHVCWGTLSPLSQAVYNSALVFTSSFWRASRWAGGWELRAFSGLSWARALFWVCVCPLPDSQSYVRAIQSSTDISSPRGSSQVFG